MEDFAKLDPLCSVLYRRMMTGKLPPHSQTKPALSPTGPVSPAVALLMMDGTLSAQARAPAPVPLRRTADGPAGRGFVFLALRAVLTDYCSATCRRVYGERVIVTLTGPGLLIS